VHGAEANLLKSPNIANLRKLETAFSVKLPLSFAPLQQRERAAENTALENARELLPDAIRQTAKSAVKSSSVPSQASRPAPNDAGTKQGKQANRFPVIIAAK